MLIWFIWIDSTPIPVFSTCQQQSDLLWCSNRCVCVCMCVSTFLFIFLPLVLFLILILWDTAATFDMLNWLVSTSVRPLKCICPCVIEVRTHVSLDLLKCTGWKTFRACGSSGGSASGMMKDPVAFVGWMWRMPCTTSPAFGLRANIVFHFVYGIQVNFCSTEWPQRRLIQISPGFGVCVANGCKHMLMCLVYMRQKLILLGLYFFNLRGMSHDEEKSDHTVTIECLDSSIFRVFSTFWGFTNVAFFGFIQQNNLEGSKGLIGGFMYTNELVFVIILNYLHAHFADCFVSGHFSCKAALLLW